MGETGKEEVERGRRRESKEEIKKERGVTKRGRERDQDYFTIHPTQKDTQKERQQTARVRDR